MPNRLPLRVCVLAPTSDQLQAVEPEPLRNLVAESDPDLAESYADHPDDWRPFDTRRRIVDYVEDAGFELDPQSYLLGDTTSPEARNALEEEVDLFVIDPLFLALTNQFPRVVPSLNALVKRKHFCIVIPEAHPPDLRRSLRELRDQGLDVLRVVAFRDGCGEWEAESIDRLRHYLARVRRVLADGPVGERISSVRETMSRSGTPAPELKTPPRLGEVA